MEGYKSEIKEVIYGALGWREKIQIKDTQNAMSIESDMTFKPEKIAIVHVCNPYTEDGEREYDVCVIVAEEGMYKTSSESFNSSLRNIINEISEANAEDEDWEIRVRAVKSKKNQGSFFTAELI